MKLPLPYLWLRLVLALVLLAGVLPSVRAESVLSRHPYLQMATQNSMTIVWRTVGASIPIVRYGAAPDALNQELLPVQILVRLSPDLPGPVGSRRLHTAPENTYQYEATIYGLSPGTTYYYGIYDGVEELAGNEADHFFKTLPATDSEDPLRLWVVGDSGNGSAAQIAGFSAMRGFVAADGKPIDAYLHLGDMAYGSGRDPEFSANYFTIYTELLRNTVAWPTMGNHEGYTSSGVTQIGPYYDAYVMPTQAEAGGVASGTEAYYGFDIGPVHFICLNSHDLDRGSTGDMALWLKADLEMTNAEWLIAFWHHPPYTKGSHDSDRETRLIEMREIIMPILESGGVDLVLGGHSHTYERSMLIDGAYATPTTADGVILDDGDGDPAGDGAYLKPTNLAPNGGTVAVVAGHGRSAGQYYGLSPIMRATIPEVGSFIVDIEDDVLTGTMVNSAMVTRDVFQIIKQDGFQPGAPLSYPWQPIGPNFLVAKPSTSSPFFVEILPVPDAPDAVIHYTTDGSEPTTSSSVYNSAIALVPGQQIRAFTVWRGGSRQGAVGEYSPPVPTPNTIQFVPSADNDGVEDVLGEVDLNASTMLLAANNLVGLRFTNVRIPKLAFPLGATIQFEASQADRFVNGGSIWGEMTADSPPFTEAVQDFSLRTSTAAQKYWSAGAWSPGRSTRSTTPDLRTIIEEIIELPGWQAGNAMSFFFSHDVTSDDLSTVYSYDQSRRQSASLTLSYLEPDSVMEHVASAPIGIQPTGADYVSVRFEWPIPLAAQKLNLGYQIEASSDLQTWSPVSPSAITTSFSVNPGYQFLHASIAPQAGITRRYFRLKYRQLP